MGDLLGEAGHVWGAYRLIRADCKIRLIKLLLQVAHQKSPTHDTHPLRHRIRQGRLGASRTSAKLERPHPGGRRALYRAGHKCAPHMPPSLNACLVTCCMHRSLK